MREPRIRIEPGSDPRHARVCRLVGPSSINLVTTVSPDGRVNTAPFSFVMPCNYDPPMICFVCGEQKHFTEYGYDPRQSSESPDTRKDTLVNILATGEFVISPVDQGLRTAVVVADQPWPYGTSELEKAELRTEPASRVRVPLIRDAMISLECRLVQTVPVRGNHLVIGEVVMIHASPDALTDGTPDVARIAPIFEGVLDNQYFELGGRAPLDRRRPYDYDALVDAAGHAARTSATDSTRP